MRKQSTEDSKTELDERTLDRLLTHPIAFHKVFVDIAGSITAGLMLSQAYYWTPRTKDPDGWFYKTQKEWERETGLSRSEQESARKKLRDRGLMEEDHRGIPAQLYFRVDRRALIAAIHQLGEQVAGNPHTSLLRSDKQDLRDPEPKNEGSPPTITENTPETITENTVRGDAASQPDLQSTSEERKTTQSKTNLEDKILYEAVLTACNLSEEFLNSRVKREITDTIKKLRTKYPDREADHLKDMIVGFRVWWTNKKDKHSNMFDPPAVSTLLSQWNNYVSYCRRNLDGCIPDIPAHW